jgi:DNA-binding transcriptional LysR family regulator
MNRPSPSLDDLRIFTLVARLANFSRVAEQKNLAPSSVSMAISRLEAQVGARLFQRTTRKMVLTNEGVTLLARSERLLEDFDEVTDLFRGAETRLTGRLRVDVPLGMAAGLVMQRLPEFHSQHPGLLLDIFSTDRRVDVIADGVDCVVRVGAATDASLVCRPLGVLPLVNVASPAYIEAYGMPDTPMALASHYLVNYAPNPSDPAAKFEYMDCAVKRTVSVPHRVTVNNSPACSAACRAGFGIAQLPFLGVASYLASGMLVQVLPDHVPAAMRINLLFPHRRNVPRRVRLFGDWLSGVIDASMGGSSSA